MEKESIFALIRRMSAVLGLMSLLAHPVEAQQRSPVDSLVAAAITSHPAARAVQMRIDAARARVRPAGQLPDPMVGIGVMNLPVNAAGYDEMTMNTLRIAQTLPLPTRLRLQRSVAEADGKLAEALMEPVVADVRRDVQLAYYDLAFVEQALVILVASQQVVVGLISASESRYALGAGSQQELLRLQVEAARIAEEAVVLSEQRRATVARLNALLNRPGDSEIAPAHVPLSIARSAVSPDPTEIRFATNALGSRVADSPIPGVATLQQRAAVENPEIREFQARIALESMRVRQSEQAHLPDFDVELQYGQRPGHPDMLSLMVSAPVPLRRSARQRQEVLAVRAEMSALQQELAAHALELNADIAALHSELESIRSQLALYVKSILPQGRAAFESAATGYAAGRTDFAVLLESRTAVLQYELSYHRLMADFARKLAELERLTGSEVIDESR